MKRWMLLIGMIICLAAGGAARAENIVFPADAGVVDVTRPPYNARGDGRADDTEAIQRALDDHPAEGAIIYMPNGIYLITRTLTWPHGPRGGMEEKNTILQGQSRDGVTLRLADHAAGFGDPKQRQGLIWTGHKPAQRFRNAVHNLTLDTGKGNPGAVGMQFMANNQGGVFDVRIRSGDGSGPAGLDLAYTDEEGPCLIRNVEVTGFDVGIWTSHAVDSVTMEHITVRGQKEYGVRNDGQVVSIRGLRSRNAVPAVYNGGGPSLMTLLDCTLEGEGAGAQPAVVTAGALFARNLQATGYARAIRNDADPARTAEGLNVKEFTSRPALSLFPGTGRSLGLPVKESPEVPWDDLKDWASPLQFGARPDAPKADISGALQAAIDSGKTTVYIPNGKWMMGKTVTVRGNVRRIIGCEASLGVAGEVKRRTEPLFRIADGASPVVVIERLRFGYEQGPFARFEQDSRRTLVLRNLTSDGGESIYRGLKDGELFLDDVCGDYLVLGKGERVWARQLNVENQGTHIVNDGADLWILGYKTERGGTLIETRGGGRTEVLGGFGYSTSGVGEEPMFSIAEGAAAFIFREACFNRKPYGMVVRETRGGVTKTLARDGTPRATGGALLTLFSGAGEAGGRK